MKLKLLFLIGLCFGIAHLVACSPKNYTRNFFGVKGTFDINKPNQIVMPNIRWSDNKSVSILLAEYRDLYNQIINILKEKPNTPIPSSLNNRALNISEAIGFKIRNNDSDDEYFLIEKYVLDRELTGGDNLLRNIATCRAVEIYKKAQYKWGTNSPYGNDGLIEMGIYHSQLYVMSYPNTNPPIAVPPPKESLCDCLEYPSGGCPK